MAQAHRETKKFIQEFTQNNNLETVQNLISKFNYFVCKIESLNQLIFLFEELTELFKTLDFQKVTKSDIFPPESLIHQPGYFYNLFKKLIQNSFSFEKQVDKLGFKNISQICFENANALKDIKKSLKLSIKFQDIINSYKRLKEIESESKSESEQNNYRQAKYNSELLKIQKLIPLSRGLELFETIDTECTEILHTYVVKPLIENIVENKNQRIKTLQANYERIRDSRKNMTSAAGLMDFQFSKYFNLITGEPSENIFPTGGNITYSNNLQKLAAGFRQQNNLEAAEKNIRSEYEFK